MVDPDLGDFGLLAAAGLVDAALSGVSAPRTRSGLGAGRWFDLGIRGSGERCCGREIVITARAGAFLVARFADALRAAFLGAAFLGAFFTSDLFAARLRADFFFAAFFAGFLPAPVVRLAIPALRSHLGAQMITGHDSNPALVSSCGNGPPETQSSNSIV